MKSLIEKIAKSNKADELVRTYFEAQTGCPVTYYYSFDGFRKLMKGFDVVKIYKDHIFPYRIDKYVNYEYEMLWYFRLMQKTVFRWLEKRLGWHTMAAAKLKVI